MKRSVSLPRSVLPSNGTNLCSNNQKAISGEDALRSHRLLPRALMLDCFTSLSLIAKELFYQSLEENTREVKK